MRPSAKEVEEVISASLKRGNWSLAVTLLAGAVKLPCVPTTRTYVEVITAVAKHSTWEQTVRLIDRLHTSPLSARALFHTAADASIIECGSGASDFLFAIIRATQRRQVILAARHYIKCSRLLLNAGNWRGALLAGSQERLVPHSPELAHSLMLAAATGRQWVVGTKIMTSLLTSGITPSGSITENFIRCFTPMAPWWRALAVASVLNCSKEPQVSQVACELREEVKRNMDISEKVSTKNNQEKMIRVLEGQQELCDLTFEEAVDVLIGMKEKNWKKALDLICRFPTLLSLRPRPCALLSPMKLYNNELQRCFNWEVVWQVISQSLVSASINDILVASTAFSVYLRDNENLNSEQTSKEMIRAGGKICNFITNSRSIKDKQMLEPTILNSFVQSACACGWWKYALSLSERPSLVFSELLEGSQWQAAVAVYNIMQSSAQERSISQLEHMFISRGLWVPALQYAHRHLPEDTLPLRSLAIPLCAALGQWDSALSMLINYVHFPTSEEKNLQYYCILQKAEESIRSSFKSSDWIKALGAWTTVQQLSKEQNSMILNKKEKEERIKIIEEEKYKHLRLSPYAVRCTAKLLLDYQRYDECCMVVSAHIPVASDPILLICLQLFHRIRLSPMLYGRVLQEYRDEHISYRVVIDLYAVLALCVSENYLGAFSILQQLTLNKDVGVKSIVSRGLDEVPHLKKFFPIILIQVVEPSRVHDMEVVFEYFLSCVSLLNDINLFNELISNLWGSKNNIIRESGLHLSVHLLKYFSMQEIPIPKIILNIVSEGLENPIVLPVTQLLFQCALYHSTLEEPKYGKSNHKYESLQYLPGENEKIFQRCSKAFIRMGLWDSALEAMQYCENTNVETLFRTAIFLKEERNCRERKAHRVMVKVASSASEEDNSIKISPEYQKEDAILALIEFQAWKAALTVYSNNTDRNQCLIDKGNCSQLVIGALLSCVATFGPWETALKLLREVHKNISHRSVYIEKGITDILHSVQFHSGSIMCGKVLLFLVEEIGIIPTSTQYEILLRSYLSSNLTAVERDLSAANLKRLGKSLNERQIIDLIVAITTSGVSLSLEEENNNIKNKRKNQLKQIGLNHSVIPVNWLPVERPPLSVDEFQSLCFLAPRIVLATSRILEELSRYSFSGRFRPFELKILLQHYRSEILAQVNLNDNKDIFDTSLVDYCKESKLLHVLLVPYEGAWRRISSSNNKSETVSVFVERLRWEIFQGFATPCTVSAVWELCLPFVATLVGRRWPWLCEYELVRAVRRGGRPPVSLLTRPEESKLSIASYWATFGRVLWPSLFFSGPEMCQLAVYVPLVEPLLQRGRDKEFRELIAGIQAAHFSSEVIPQEEALMRQPHSSEAIYTVFKLAFKTLKRLHTQLDLDSRGGRYYYHHHPDDSLWRRYEQQLTINSITYGSPRWSLALRILYHYRRSNSSSLQPRTIAALFAACAADADADGNICSCEEKKNQKTKISWWELGIRCAQSVEPTINKTFWLHALQLVNFSLSNNDNKEINIETYRVEDISDNFLQATIRVLINHAKQNKSGIPFDVSLLLVDQMKEILSDSHSYTNLKYMKNGEDALIVWALLLKHQCLEKMESLHATLFRRLVQDGPSTNGLI